jgi:dipeptidyl aminopeptidase/acylaminoacyl peptidase
MSSPLWTVDEILRLHCPAQSAWSPDGSLLSCVWSGAGEEELHLLHIASGIIGTIERLPPLLGDDTSGAKMWGSVQTAYEWWPDSSALLRVAKGIWKYDLRTGRHTRLTPGEEPESHPSWSPDERRFAFRQGGRVACYDLATDSIVSFPVPGLVYEFAPQLTWSPNGACVAVAFRRRDATGKPALRGLDVAVVSLDGRLIWASDTIGTIANPQWVDGDNLLFTRFNETRTVAEHVIVNVMTGDEWVLLIEQEPRGIIADFVEGLGARGPLIAPQQNEAVLVHPVDGWPHLHLLDLESGALRQLTQGECEDTSPLWSPDGKQIAYLSNGHPSLSSSGVWVLDRDTGESRCLVSLAGAKDELAWSPDGCSLSFLHAGPGEPPGLWMVHLDDLSCCRLAPSEMPEAVWTHDVPPQEVWMQASDGRRVPGLLYTRPDLRARPAIIWLHGGPGMQYFLGWPTDFGGCIHHAFHQLLTQEGYSILYLNYRGSTGYGMEHEQGNHLRIGVSELADVEGAARFLASLPQVASDQLCVAGRSYGGFVALCALARLPELFRLGVVIAGLGDLSGSLDDSGPDFWDDSTSFRWRLGWSREQHPQVWRAANILPDLERLRAPLLIFHGLQDQAVPVEQIYPVEQRCRELGKPCFARYYDGEDHVFSSKETWRDVFENIKFQLSNLKR